MSPAATMTDKEQETKPEAASEAVEEKVVDKEAAEAKKAAEAVTSYRAEKESNNVADAVAAEQSLPAVEPKKGSTFAGEISKDDLTAVMEECDLVKEDAEALLKRADGSLQKAVEFFLADQ